MMDLYLRAANAGIVASALPWLRREDDLTGERVWITAGDGFAFDPIGTLVLNPGTRDEDGTELTPPVIATGWHANLRCTEEVAARVPETLRVNPAEPKRAWA